MGKNTLYVIFRKGRKFSIHHPSPIHSVSPSEVWGECVSLLPPPPARSVAPKPFLHASTPAKPPSMGVCVISVPLKSPSTEYWKVCMTFLHIVVIGTTCLRLLHRCQTKRMWWDDYSAFIVLVVDLMYILHMWLRCRSGGKHTRFSSSNSDKYFLVAGLISPSFIYSVWFTTAIGWTVIW